MATATTTGPPRRDEWGGDRRAVRAWRELPEAERSAIEAEVRAANPGMDRWRVIFEAFCIEKAAGR